MEERFLISDAAKEVKVETHVLRYWEEELGMEVSRNEFGHRYYTRENIDCFKRIKMMKDQGIGLKAIKVILHEGKLDIIEEGERSAMQVCTLEGNMSYELQNATKEEKGRRMQYLLSQMIKEAVMEGNAALITEVKDAVIKELDYQFRQREEIELEREKRMEQRNEEHYQRIDELLRKKSKRHSIF